jgi:preprotein translocase subunit YajC
VFLADTSSGGSSLFTLLTFVLLGLAFYFLLLRPQNKRRREAAAMQSRLGPGDEVQTVGGLFGTVTQVGGDAVTIEAAPGVELRFAVGAIARVVTKVATDEPAAEADDTSDAAKTIEQA